MDFNVTEYEADQVADFTLHPTFKKLPTSSEVLTVYQTKYSKLPEAIKIPFPYTYFCDARFLHILQSATLQQNECTIRRENPAQH